MSVTNKIVVWGSNPNQYDSGNPYQPDANGNEKGFTPGTLNYALYLNKALRNASIVPHALAQMLTHSPVTDNLDINFDINPGDIPTFDANFRSAFDAYIKSTIKVDNATHADTADACTGNSATASKLQTAITIGGVSFDGSSSINLPGVNTAGNQNTSGNAATATKATGDQSGNNIKATYAASLAFTDATGSSHASVSLKNKNGNVIATASFSKVSNAFNADYASNASNTSKLTGFNNAWTEISITDGKGSFNWTEGNVYEFKIVFTDALGNYNNFVNAGIITMLIQGVGSTQFQYGPAFPAAKYTGNDSPKYACLGFDSYYNTKSVSLCTIGVTGVASIWNTQFKLYYRLIQNN